MLHALGPGSARRLPPVFAPWWLRVAGFAAALPLLAFGQDAPPPRGPVPIRGAGVPVPRGVLKPGAALRLAGQKQGAVPVQVSERTRWPDGSVQWLWLDFQADPGDRYGLDLGASAAPAAPTAPGLTVTSAEATLTVDTGVLRLTWRKDRATPTEVRVPGGAAITDDGLGIYAVDNRGRQGALGGEAAELAWTVEASGPVRAVLRAL